MLKHYWIEKKHESKEIKYTNTSAFISFIYNFFFHYNCNLELHPYSQVRNDKVQSKHFSAQIKAKDYEYSVTLNSIIV